MTSTFVDGGIAWMHSALSCYCILLFQLPGSTYITGEHNCYTFQVAGMLAETKACSTLQHTLFQPFNGSQTLMVAYGRTPALVKSVNTQEIHP